MSTTFSANQKLDLSAVGDLGWGPVVAHNWNTLDALTPVGSLAVTTSEVPSASLTVAISAGSFATPWGSVVAYGGGTLTVSGGTTTYLWLSGAGSLQSGASFPTGTFYVPLAKVVSGTSTIGGITDQRICFGTVNVQSQPVMGSATAGSSWTSTEQAMLNAVYSAVRALDRKSVV